MPKKTSMNDLRDHLFETIELLKDPESGMDINKAKTIAQIGQTLINTANTEMEYMKFLGKGEKMNTDFFPTEIDSRAQLPDHVKEARRP